MSRHRVPLVRATRILQHVAAGLATILVVGAVGVLGARVSAPDGPTPRVGVGLSPTRTFPDEPRGVPAPVAPALPGPVVVEPEPAPTPRPVVATQPPPQWPVVVIVQDPTPPPAVVAASDPEPVVWAPAGPPEPPKPTSAGWKRQRWETRAQTASQGTETTGAGVGQGQLCAVVCVQLSNDTTNGDEEQETKEP